MIDLLVEEKPSKRTKDQLLGAYVIDTSHNELTVAEIWSIYTTLGKVEDSFRALKSDLGLRPFTTSWPDEQLHIFSFQYLPITYFAPLNSLSGTKVTNDAGQP